MRWFLAAVKNYATFSGRAQRSEYWFFFLIWWLSYIGLAVLESLVTGTAVLAGVWAIALLLPSIAVSVRRLHDTDRSGLWLLLNFIPLIGWLVLFIFNVKDSQSGANRFGPNPKGVGEAEFSGEPAPTGSKAWIIGITAAIAVPVLGIVLAVALPAYQNYVERAKKAEASAVSRPTAKSVQQATTGEQKRDTAVSPIPVAPPPAAAEAIRPAIETVKAPAALPLVVESPVPPPIVATPSPKTNPRAAEPKTKTQAPMRVASESAEPPRPKAKEKASECVYKPVMSDEDIAKCR